MPNKPGRAVRNFLIYAGIAALVPALNLTFILLRFFGVPSAGEGNYVAIMAGVIMFLLYAMVRFFPFSMVDSKYGIYGIILPLAGSLFIYIVMKEGSVIYLMLSLAIAAAVAVTAVIYYRAVYRILKSEGVNDYVELEMKTYKLYELNALSLLTGAAFVFYLLAASSSAAVTALAGAGVCLSMFGKIKRSVYNRKMKNMGLLLILELVCLALSYSLAAAYFYLDGVNIIFVIIMSILLEAPGAIITLRVHKEMQQYMYK